MKRTRTIIAVDAVKDAALYADWVVPLGLLSEENQPDDVPMRILFERLLPAEVKRNTKYMSVLQECLQKPSDMINDFEHLTSDDQRNKLNQLRKEQGFTIGYLSGEVWSRNKDSLAFLQRPSLEHSDELAPDPFVTSMLRLDLIDTSKLRWNDVFAVREDPQVHRKVRRLRLLFEEDYAGKPSSYIEDDINRRIEDYYDVIRDWRFETRTGILEQLLSSKAFPSLLAGSVAAFLVGSPLVAAAGTVAGASIEFGKATLEYAKRKHNLNKTIRNLPVGYLIDIGRREVPRRA